MTFEKYIIKLKKQYSDSRAHGNLHSLNEDLQDVTVGEADAYCFAPGLFSGEDTHDTTHSAL